MRAALLVAVALRGAAVPAAAQESPTPAAPGAEPVVKLPLDPGLDGPPLGIAQLGDQVEEGAAVAPGPDTAYILFRTARPMGLVFLRETSSAEREIERAAARQEAQENYRGAIAEWERIEAACRGDGAAAYRCRRPRPRPVEPDLSDVDGLISIERNTVTFLRRPAFSLVDGVHVYLMPVSPGTYALHAQRDEADGQQAGVCLCMGSVRFDVAAGQIVDVGTITFPALETIAARPRTDSAFVEGGGPSVVVVPATGAPPPAGLAGTTIVPAVLRAAGKQPNYYRLYLDRHPALPGVLRYERDRVIDGRTGTDPAPPATSLSDGG